MLLAVARAEVPPDGSQQQGAGCRNSGPKERASRVRLLPNGWPRPP